jgi:hypothetical protein
VTDVDADAFVAFATRYLSHTDGTPFRPTAYQLAILQGLGSGRVPLLAGKRAGVPLQRYADLAVAYAILTGQTVAIIARDPQTAEAMRQRALAILDDLDRILPTPTEGPTA